MTTNDKLTDERMSGKTLEDYWFGIKTKVEWGMNHPIYYIYKDHLRARANEKFLERGLSAIHCENEKLRIHIAALKIKVETLEAENAELKKQVKELEKENLMLETRSYAVTVEIPKREIK